MRNLGLGSLSPAFLRPSSLDPLREEARADCGLPSDHKFGGQPPGPETDAKPGRESLTRLEIKTVVTVTKNKHFKTVDLSVAKELWAFPWPHYFCSKIDR